MLRTLRGLWGKLTGQPAGLPPAGSPTGAEHLQEPGRVAVARLAPVATEPPQEPEPGPVPAAPAPDALAVERPLEELFGPFAEVLGVEVPAEPEELPEEDEAADAELAGQLLARFRASPPEQASFPALALQVLNLVASPTPDVGELSRIIQRDPALSAGVLSVANSVIYRGLMEIENVREAVARLGAIEVGRVAAAVSARTLFSPRMRQEQVTFGPRWAVLFGHAVAVGSAGAALALRHRGARADRVYLGGLLHDVGKSMALRATAALLLESRIGAPEPARLERVLDRVHVEIGGEAHQAWALPHYLTVMCVRHHDAVVPLAPEFVDLHILRLASGVADLRDPPFAARAAREIAQSAGVLQLDPFAVRTLVAELRQAELRAAALAG